MRVLLVDDEARSAAYLRKGLAQSGFAVDVARMGEQGLELARKSDYDLMVLNSRQGWPMISELRRAGRQTPVLFLSADSPPRLGSQRPTDDGLPKPYAFSDFLTRIHSALGWGREHELEKLRIRDLEIDLMRQRAVRAGQRLDLTQKEFLLLSLLARRSGEVLSRTLIADQVWDINFDSNTNFVDVHIRRLRSKLDDPFERKLIHTVRGRGYVLEER
jgi:two-component system copper resistance phosphate regulon response regulator CusR